MARWIIDSKRKPYTIILLNEVLTQLSMTYYSYRLGGFLTVIREASDYNT